MRKLLAVLLLAAAPALAQVTGVDSTVRTYGGVEESLSSAASDTAEPFALVSANVWLGKIDIHTKARFGGSTGAAVDLTSISTFKTLDFNGSVLTPFTSKYNDAFLEAGILGGFQTRPFSSTPTPADKTAKRIEAVVRLIHKHGGEVTGGFGYSTEFAPYGVWAGFVTARVPLQGPNGLFWLGGEAGFPIEQATVSDVVRVYVALSLKNITIKTQAVNP